VASRKAASTAADSAEQSRTSCRAGEHGGEATSAQAIRADLILRHGHRKVLRIVPDGKLWRIEWPDIGPSPAVNLTRAKEAARLWAEAKMLRHLRKNGAARALKSLDNFSWSSSPVRKSGAVHTELRASTSDAPTLDDRWRDFPPDEGVS
jgi:hypothetical protein